ncbi:SpoIIE family protein phosphatase [Streptomyces roseoverticillatus]|uniref:PP2C family protein-serine/threonine phosphatase n=1 Tax=Streptomyces roseoverticillatus TaxID=66429 RepID=UPI001F1FCC19|nr:SpoIIE family protein phosphatase [Streptomyces roseoverticillatus]MCF3100292.1 SpoIIE family protein phosphatase [Streptomyces roseoverticillatus]
MTTPHLPKVAGINPPVTPPAQTPAPTSAASSADPLSPAAPGTPGTEGPEGAEGPGHPDGAGAPACTCAPANPSGAASSAWCGPLLPAPNALVQDRLAGWISDLTTLQDLTERLTRTGGLDAALHEALRAGAALVGARRGLVTLHPATGPGREHPVTVGFGLDHADLGHIETIPEAGRAGGDRPADPGPPESGRRTRRPAAPHPEAARPQPAYGRLFDDLPPAGSRSGTAHPDIAADEALDPRHREVAARLGYGASYAVPLETEHAGRIGAAVWLYDEPAEPTERQRHLVGLYRDHATEHLARQLELAEARQTVATLREELLPSRLPRTPGIRLAVRHRTGPLGGGDWYDALPLPEGALGLAVGGVSDSGPGAVAAVGRMRASLRAYAVMEGEDPVAVLSDLELLLRLTEPSRAATAIFAYCEPSDRKVVLAGAGHCPPLIIGDHRVEFVETSLSAPLGMLACWEAPSVEIEPAPGETLLFYSDGLLHRTGQPMDRAFARLRTAAAGVPKAARRDPDAVVEHVLRTVLPQEDHGEWEGSEDVVLLAAHFD